MENRYSNNTKQKQLRVKTEPEGHCETEQDDPEVELVGVRYAALEGVIGLTIQLAQEVLRKSTRPFVSCTRFIFLSYLPVMKPLGPGHGFLILRILPKANHMVALWRGQDGVFMYFDSIRFPVPDEVHSYIKSCGQEKLVTMPWAIQLPSTATCGYHCFAFVNYVSQKPHIPTPMIPPRASGRISGANISGDFGRN